MRPNRRLKLWFYAIYLFATSRHGVPAEELQRQLGVTCKTAWRKGHEIRKLMAVDGDGPLSGQAEADEAYVDGVAKGPDRGLHLDTKAVLFGMVQRDGDIITKVVSNNRRATLMREIGHKVRRGSTVRTDESGAYGGLEGFGYKHPTVNHSKDEHATKEGQ